jgi:glycosyltransferase involved in cell wall biosynthesis
MISVTILTKNSEKYLEEVLKSLESFDEVLILDNGSDDSTIEITKNFNNVKVATSKFLGFGKLHNLAADLCKNDWILSIDSDEILSKGLIHEIRNYTLDPMCVYEIPRQNYYRGKEIKCCGWYPEKVIRLFNRRLTSFSDSEVHEKVLRKNLNKITLKNPLKHYPYSNLSDFLKKMQHYSELFAIQYQGKKKSTPFKALRQCLFAFFKSYFLKKGFLGGYEGFLISMYNAHTAFYKYLKLYELNKSQVT